MPSLTFSMFLITDIIVRETEGKGRGVYATKHIPCGTVIGEYNGIIRPSSKNYYGKLVYDMYYSDDVDICPDPDSYGLHLVNHSCEANCATDSLGRRTILYAFRKIFAGEELSYDYFLGPQEEDDFAGSGNCYCGSVFCRGTMYSNPAQYKLVKEWEEKEFKGVSAEPPVPFGEMLPPLDSYPKTVDHDDLIISVFGSREVEPLVNDELEVTNVAELRALLKESGRQISLSKSNVIVEGALFSGQLLYRQ